MYLHKSVSVCISVCIYCTQVIPYGVWYSDNTDCNISMELSW